MHKQEKRKALLYGMPANKFDFIWLVNSPSNTLIIFVFYEDLVQYSVFL